MTGKLRFIARGTAQVIDPFALDRDKPLRRFVGRALREVVPGRWAFVPTGEAEEQPYHHDLVKACKDGDLWPADEATAKACGVPFDPRYGGEVAQTIKEFKAQQEAAKAQQEAADKAKAEPAAKKGGS